MKSRNTKLKNVETTTITIIRSLKNQGLILTIMHIYILIEIEIKKLK